MRISSEDRTSKAIRDASAKGLTVSVAESCTGGLLASTLTDVPGASACFKGCIVAYSNAVKVRMLGVDKETIDRYGAVSRETAEEMAIGCRKAFGTDIAVALTGIAGPSGVTPDKPIGTLFIALSVKGKATICEGFLLGGIGRIEFKEKAVERALGMISGAIDHMESRMI